MEAESCRMCGGDAADAEARVAEVVNHESTHGRCTKTFLKKVRKQTRPAG